jgi:soluble lytic murein transglycosylase-like protein
MKQLILIALLLPTTAFARNQQEVVEKVRIINAIRWAAHYVGVPEDLMVAVAWVESSHRANLPAKLDGSTPSYGVFQIKLETAQWVDKVYKHKKLATRGRLLSVDDNCVYAAKYMKLLLKRYDGSWKMAVDAYNKGHVVSLNSQYVQRVSKALGVK